MASTGGLHLVLLLLLVLTSFVMSKKAYIVQMKGNIKPTAFLTHEDWYLSSLQSVLDDANPDNNAKTNLLYAYTDVCKGFAVTLEPEQVEAMKQSGEVLGMYEDVSYELHTTRTPQYLNVADEFGMGGSDISVDGKFTEVIVGMIDTGITPESMSFNDYGFPEIPKKWKGVCVNASDFDPAKNCNKKLIGARYFVEAALADSKFSRRNFTDVITPRDYDGHGTHTASTATGLPVPNASLFGHALGTARGMAPHARIASYKVCWGYRCMAADILAAMDQAIKDGVDVISMSVGGGERWHYDMAPTAIGAFALLENGIFLSASAGNSGPGYGTVANGAPWIMTVGASSIDRNFAAYVTLGNNRRLKGISVTDTSINGQKFPLVYARESNASRLCMENTLDPKVVSGKVVLCDDDGQLNMLMASDIVRQAGAVGMIMIKPVEFGLATGMMPPAMVLPSILVGFKDGYWIKKYVMSDPNPMVTFTFVPEELNVKPSPVVANFSSRGPFNMSPQILKPDVIGPGVGILASWRGISPSGYSSDTRKTDFNIISGTSMSCPHVSGIVALIKAMHPDWSPGAIKSALMTTAYIHDSTRHPIRDQVGIPADPWAIGAGHIDPRKALNPGLVYDTTPQDFVKFLCSLNYSMETVQQITRNSSATCSDKYADPGDLNYPSFAVSFAGRNNVTYSRELTNVGNGGIYRVKIQAPPTVSVTVNPRRLVFKNVGEKVKYQVTFMSLGNGAESVDGSIAWVNRHNRVRVRSPVVFNWKKLGGYY